MIKRLCRSATRPDRAIPCTVASSTAQSNCDQTCPAKRQCDCHTRCQARWDPTHVWPAWHGTTPQPVQQPKDGDWAIVHDGLRLINLRKANHFPHKELRRPSAFLLCSVEHVTKVCHGLRWKAFEITNGNSIYPHAEESFLAEIICPSTSGVKEGQSYAPRGNL